VGGRWDDKAEGLNGSSALTPRAEPFSPHVKSFIRRFRRNFGAMQASTGRHIHR
jgi:hypothetical protein